MCNWSERATSLGMGAGVGGRYPEFTKCRAAFVRPGVSERI